MGCGKVGCGNGLKVWDKNKLWPASSLAWLRWSCPSSVPSFLRGGNGTLQRRCGSVHGAREYFCGKGSSLGYSRRNVGGEWRLSRGLECTPAACLLLPQPFLNFE